MQNANDRDVFTRHPEVDEVPDAAHAHQPRRYKVNLACSGRANPTARYVGTDPADIAVGLVLAPPSFGILPDVVEIARRAFGPDYAARDR
jgi:hypothetical protein